MVSLNKEKCPLIRTWMSCSRLGIGCLAIAFLLARQSPADVVINVSEVGGNLQFSGTGSIDLASTQSFNTTDAGNTTFGFQNSILNGPFGSYVGVTAPSAFIDIYNIANVVVTGQSALNQDYVVLTSSGPDTAFANTNSNIFFANSGYVSNSAISINATLAGLSFADIGHTEGDFTKIQWSNGTVTEFIQMNFNNTIVPEPSAIPILASTLLIRVSACRRRKMREQRR